MNWKLAYKLQYIYTFPKIGGSRSLIVWLQLHVFSFLKADISLEQHVHALEKKRHTSL